MSGKETEYNGPDTNPVYSDEDSYETFDDLDNDDEIEDNDDEQQSATSHDNQEEEEDEESEEQKLEKPRREARKKKEAAKKARGQKGDDIDALDNQTETFEDLDEEEEEDATEDEELEESDKPEEVEAKKTEDAKALSKTKPSYVTIGDETYALDSSALVSLSVDGKNEKVTLQELKNQYNAKVVGDKRFNEINLKEQAVKRTESEVNQKLSHYTKVKQQIDEIIKDETKNPKDALKIFLDQSGVDSYDLMERMFKADLTELANVLNMEPAERKAYFLEKKNSHLLEQSKKRDEQSQADNKRNSYTQKVDALRKSYGVSEAQYVDALEELRTYGEKDEDLSEKEIVEWAATKPHRETVKTLLTPYQDQLEGKAYGELSWKLANILREGSETPDLIKKHLAEVFGVPTEVKQLSKKLNPLGRKSVKAPVKPTTSSKKKNSYESFDDFEED